MRFLCVYKPGKETSDQPPTPEEIARMGKLIDEMTRAGVLLASEGCLPSSRAARVQISAGKFTVTDGPFPETKELIAGMAMLQVKSKEEAVEWCKRFLTVAGEGQNEILQLRDLPVGP